MKLCIITPSFTGGGAEKIAVNLANQYAEEGVDVSLLVFINSGPYKEQLSNKVRLIDLGVSRLRYSFFKFRKALIKENPSHVLSVIRVSSIMAGLVIPKASGCVLTYREANTMDGIQRLSFFKKNIYRLLMKLSYRKANSIIANSEDTKKDLIKSGVVNESKITVISNPVIPNDLGLKVSETVDHEWLFSGYKVVLNVGRLHVQKNQSLLIEAFSYVLTRHPKAKLLILGEGTERFKLIDKIIKLGLQSSIQLIPFQNNPFPYYSASNLFVLTSDWEGFGNILVEALACGTPVVSTDCPGGPRTILADGIYGTLVPCGNVEILANAICEQLDQPDYWDRDILKARGQEYTIDVVAAKYLEHLKSISPIK